MVQPTQHLVIAISLLPPFCNCRRGACGDFASSTMGTTDLIRDMVPIACILVRSFLLELTNVLNLVQALGGLGINIINTGCC